MQQRGRRDRVRNNGGNSHRLFMNSFYSAEASVDSGGSSSKEAPKKFTRSDRVHSAPFASLPKGESLNAQILRCEAASTGGEDEDQRKPAARVVTAMHPAPRSFWLDRPAPSGAQPRTRTASVRIERPNSNHFGGSIRQQEEQQEQQQREQQQQQRQQQPPPQDYQKQRQTPPPQEFWKQQQYQQPSPPQGNQKQRQTPQDFREQQQYQQPPPRQDNQKEKQYQHQRPQQPPHARERVPRLSSFYRSAMEAAADMGEDHKSQRANTSRDEELAKELAAQHEREELELQLRDEALARELEESLRIEALEALEATKRDELLAMEFTKNEEKEAISSTQKQQTADDDLKLAMKMMQMESSSFRQIPQRNKFDEDAAFALALAETENSLHPPHSLAIPEQMQILQQIRQQKEQIKQQTGQRPNPLTPRTAMMVESTDQYIISQRLAIQEWMAQQDQMRPPTRDMLPWSGVDCGPSTRLHELHTRGVHGEDDPPLGAGWEFQGRNIQEPLRYDQEQISALRPLSTSLHNPPGYNQGQIPAPRGTYVLHHHQSNMSQLDYNRQSRSHNYARADQPHMGTPSYERHDRPQMGTPLQRQGSGYRGDEYDSNRTSAQRPSWDYANRNARAPSTRLERGQMETRAAIDQGMSHVIQCLGCRKRLYAPLNNALVFCPNCRTVSPGQTASRRSNY